MEQTFVLILSAEGQRAGAIAGTLCATKREVRLVTGIDELQRLVYSGHADLVVIEDDLPGLFRGLEILERMQNHLLRPPAILLANDSLEVQRRAAKAGVEVVLPPYASLKDIHSAVEALCARRGGRRLASCPVALRLVRDQGIIEPLPQLLLKLAGHLHSAEISPTELARDIALDSAIAAELLRLTNSSVWGRSTRAASIQDALSFLGVHRSISLILSSHLLRAKGALTMSISSDTRRWHNYRSVLTASVASSFAARLEGISAETAYILGLLQDMGMLILAQAKRDRYAMLLERATAVANLRIEHLEQADFNTTHASVSAALLQRWGLPDAFIHLVRRHHDVSDERGPELEHAFLRCMRIGEAVANLSDNRSPRRVLDLNRLLSHYTRELGAQCQACLLEGIGRAQESGRLFQAEAPSHEGVQEVLAAVRGWKADGDPRTDPIASDDNQERDVTGLAVGLSGPLVTASAIPMRPQILVIEDEATIVDLISSMLAPVGVKVLSCDNLIAARRLVRDAIGVLCDVHLGETRGNEIVAALGADGFSGRIIMISGDNQRGTVEVAIRAGIDGYLLKPFSQVTLLEKILPHFGDDESSPVQKRAVMADGAV